MKNRIFISLLLITNIACNSDFENSLTIENYQTPQIMLSSEEYLAITPYMPLQTETIYSTIEEFQEMLNIETDCKYCIEKSYREDDKTNICIVKVTSQSGQSTATLVCLGNYCH